MLIKGAPCYITDITNKVKGTGPTANDRQQFTGRHIYTGKQVMDIINLTAGYDGIDTPVVTKLQFSLMDVDTESGFLSLLTDSGEVSD